MDTNASRLVEPVQDFGWQRNKGNELAQMTARRRFCQHCART